MSTISKLIPLLRCQHRVQVDRQKICSIFSFTTIGGRHYSNGKAISKAKPSSEVSSDVKPLGEKIKETTKTASYMGVILIGVAVTGGIFFYVFRELFSSTSANSIFSAALEKCKEDPYVIQALGEPIKGFGEETTRRRRTRVSHAYYTRDGSNCLRMQFYIKGTKAEGTVQLDMIETEKGNYDYRYLFVQVNDYTRKVIIIEDNRATLDKKSLGTEPLQALPSIL